MRMLRRLRLIKCTVYRATYGNSRVELQKEASSHDGGKVFAGVVISVALGMLLSKAAGIAGLMSREHITDCAHCIFQPTRHPSH